MAIKPNPTGSGFVIDPDTDPLLLKNSQVGQTLQFQQAQGDRARALAAAKLAAEEAGKAAGVIERAGEQGKLALRAQAAQALAGTMGQAGAMPQGGGQLAALSQVAKDRGMAEAQYGSNVAMQAQDARQQAALAELDAAKTAREIGNITEERQRKQGAYVQQIQEIRSANQSFWGDRVGTAASQIRKLAEFESDPEMKQWLLDQAKATGKGDSGFFGIGGSL